MKKFAKWFGAGSRPERPALPEGPVDLLAPDFVADPYPTWAALRKDRPLAEVTSGGFVLTRHADVSAAFSDPALGNAPSRFSALAPKNRERHVAAAVAAHIPPFLDMPEHRLPRQALTRAFFDTFKHRQSDIAETAQRMTAEQSGRIELIGDLSSPFALRAVADFVGLSASPAELKAITHAFFQLFAPITDPAAFRETNERLAEARDLISRDLERAREAEGPSLLGALLAFQKDNPDLSDAQIVDCALLVFADGIENIEAGAASVLALILSDPGTRDAALAAGTDKAVREALRLDTPGQIIPRVAREETEVLGRTITAGTPVFLALAAANRDGDVFAEPDAFRPDRQEAAVTFGLGRHRCIGEPLGVLLLTALTGALLDRGAKLAEPGARLDYHARFGHRWPKALALHLP